MENSYSGFPSSGLRTFGEDCNFQSGQRGGVRIGIIYFICFEGIEINQRKWSEKKKYGFYFKNDKTTRKSEMDAGPSRK